MPRLIKRGYIRFSDKWEYVKSQNVGPFVAQIVHRRPDGTLNIWTSRRNRKRFGPELDPQTAQKKRYQYLLWRPRSLNWWIALLFMIGSWHFISGSVFVLTGLPNTYIIDLIFFIGSIFFTSAGYSQYYQAINAPEILNEEGEPSPQERRFFRWQPRRIDFWITFTQFLGTLAFNVSTFMAFAQVKWLGYDILVWVPDYVGSAFFLISGIGAVFEYCERVWCWQIKKITWWIVGINFIGCVAFMISAITAFVRPNPIFGNLATWATIFTLVGAVCFFVGAYLMWPEMSVEPASKM
jgi:hypothetical protein